MIQTDKRKRKHIGDKKMIRNIDMKEISDGNLYTANDMVKADCQDCKGCSACCRGMGDSIVLDPYDVWQMSAGLGETFEELMKGKIALGVVDGMILPHLDMDDGTLGCPILRSCRCKIHAFRPGICRLFPLGRFYEEDGFKYFLQIHECQKKDRTKIKVKKWLGIANLKAYENYITSWHAFLKKCRDGNGRFKCGRSKDFADFHFADILSDTISGRTCRWGCILQ